MKEKSIINIRNVWESRNSILNPVNKEVLLEVIDSVASIFAAGSYFYYIFNFESYQMEFVHANVEKILGVKPEEYSLEKLFELMHPEDLELMAKKESIAIDFLFGKLKPEELSKYKTSYIMRFKSNEGRYKSILHQAKAITISKGGKIQQVIGVHTDVTHLNVPIDHRISFIGDAGYPSYYSEIVEPKFEKLKFSFEELFTEREKDIIRMITKGYGFKEIADKLFISPHTVNTHKRNILYKSKCKNTAELITYCLKLGII